MDSLSSGSSSRSQSPQLHPKDIAVTNSRNDSVLAPSPKLAKDSVFQIISVCKGTSLGLNIVGGINRNEGPLVYVQEVIPGGDCHKDGRLKPGDQLVSINKESMIGVSYEEAKSIINRTSTRFESFWEIAFIRQNESYSEELQRPSSLSTSSSVVYGEQQAAVVSPLASPNGKLVSRFTTNAVSRLTTPVFLFQALNYLGIQPTDEEQQGVRQQLEKDSDRTVSFGGNDLLIALENDFVTCDLLEDDLERIKKERNEALKEISKLKEAKAAVEEARALRSRIHLAEAAQRQARGMEMDYEEVIRLLEAEIVELKAQLTNNSGQNKDNIQDLRKRVTVLDCQLRKSELARKTFEVATGKLLQFVEVVHEILSDNSASSTLLSERRTTLSTKALLARFGRIGSTVTTALAAEAKDLAKSVRAILEVDCLPYGWEEAYTADGIKYFINHVTQTTSWIHPVTSALSLFGPEDDDDGIREPPGSKS
uniref:Syntaxin binding protein 4 n=1 Tax=Nothoprocta perdicaria TaxID=30464 RepID=A0A8C7EAD9_NOTPE